ncbi:MAG: hypothetical protein AAF597_04205 [Bacteroidota bacterium]
MKYVSRLLLSALFFTACGGDTAAVEKAAMEATEAAQEKAYETMMVEGHDRVMPMMGKITATRRSIKDMLAADGLAAERKDLLTAADEQLVDAGDQMMEWMDNIKDLDQLRESMDDNGIMTYIKEQAASIGKVEVAMTAAIAAGKELIGDDHHHDHDGHDHDHDHDGHDHDHGDHKH